MDPINYLVKCEHCNRIRQFGNAKITAETFAIRHYINRRHYVSVIPSEGVPKHYPPLAERAMIRPSVQPAIGG